MQKKLCFLLMQVQKGKSIYFSTNPSLNLNLFVILMSTYYNKNNLKVKESSEHTLIEMSIWNDVLLDDLADHHIRGQILKVPPEQLYD